MGKQRLWRVLLAAAFLFLLMPWPSQAGWQQVGAAGFSPGEAYCTSLALDNSGTPYVAYRDGGNGNKASVMKFNGSSWQQVGAAGFSPGEAYCTSLALDSSGRPYVAVFDGNLLVMKFNGTSWENVGEAFNLSPFFFGLDLALDNSGKPYVVFSSMPSSSGSFKARVMKFNGTSWVQVGQDLSPGNGYSSNLALDSSGTPYITSKDGGNGNNVMKFNGTRWVQVGTAGLAGFTSLALDSRGTPYVAYEDWANGGKVSVMKFNGTSWVQVGEAGFSRGWADSISLTLDSCGMPYVAYEDYANGNKASVMRFTGADGNACDAVPVMSPVYALLLGRKKVNLLRNGSFELPSVPFGSWQPFAPDQISGWIVEHTFPFGKTSPPQLEIWNHFMSAPYSGNQHIELDSDDSTTISQSVATVPGSRYVLKYAWAPRPGGAKNLMKVWVNGSRVAFHKASGADQTTIHWTVSQYAFTATGTSTSIAFGEVGQDDGFGMLLDAVSLVQQ